MISELEVKKILDSIQKSVIQGNSEKTLSLVKKAIGKGIDPVIIIDNGLVKGIRTVGEKFENGEFFLPDLVMGSNAMQKGIELLAPQMAKDKKERKVVGKYLLGTVQGDIHDIGKNLIKIMFEAAGWTVHDLGSDVQLSRFVDEQKRIGADVIGMSALMTTSLLAMPKAVKMIRELDTKVAIMLGGAPVSLEIAKSYGADGYACNAGEAVSEANAMLSRLGR